MSEYKKEESYKTDSLDRLEEVKITDVNGEKVFHTCRLSYEEESDQGMCKVEAGDGRSIAYLYSNGLISSSIIYN